MPLREEIFQALYGASLLARLDPRGMSCFNLTIEGFWRSFLAAVISAPLYLLIVWFQPQTDAAPGLQDVTLFWRIFVETIDYFVTWATFPVIMVFVARWMGLDHLYVTYIIAYNWCQALVVLLLVVVSAVIGIGILPETIAGFALTVSFVAILYYLWFVTKTALQIEWHLAIALVLLEFVATLLVGTGVRWVLL
ncbi:MAG: hypothetical protein MI806_19605 [Minwuiales bacterium]|nr:hypothetical protein [Minwuiales bacterium]